MKPIVILCFFMVSFASCRHISGSGNIISKKMEAGTFTGISAGSSFEVEVRIGSPVSVEIEADDNLMKLVKVKVAENKLRIHSKDGFSIRDGHFKARITVPSLNYIEGTGAASIQVLDELKDDQKIGLHSSGAAHVKIASVDAPTVEAEASGASGIEVKGRTRNFTAGASGGATVHASELLSENTEADVSGAGNVHVYASVKLNAKASGAGNVLYKGEANVNKETSGAGNVNRED